MNTNQKAFLCGYLGIGTMEKTASQKINSGKASFLKALFPGAQITHDDSSIQPYAHNRADNISTHKVGDDMVTGQDSGMSKMASDIGPKGGAALGAGAGALIGAGYEALAPTPENESTKEKIKRFLRASVVPAGAGAMLGAGAGVVNQGVNAVKSGLAKADSALKGAQ